MAEQTTTVRVGERLLRLSNLDKVLYPEAGFTKGEVVDYYVKIAPLLLPRLQDRPLTLLRYPDGVTAPSFFEKHAARHAPDWIRTVRVPTPGSTKGVSHADFVLVQDLPALVWTANLAALELHVPQWTVGPRGARRAPDLLVFDLDPGAPATIVQCCAVALLVRDALAADGLTAYPKTSGAKGMQLYVPVSVRRPERTSEYARAVADRLARDHPELIVSVMAKNIRKGKVFIDWSQNNPAKTTIAAYSLRGQQTPTVSTPITWAEVQACREVADLRFTTADVLSRVDDHGDLLADLTERTQPLP